MGSSEPVKGKILNPQTSQLGSLASGVTALGALNSIVEATREYFLVRDQELTKRASIDAYERLELARIAAAEAVLKDYFRRAFDERGRNVDAIFARYDEAVERGDAQLAQASLTGMVDLAKSSPLADLGDLGEVRKALDDPDQVWNL